MTGARVRLLATLLWLVLLLDAGGCSQDLAPGPTTAAGTRPAYLSASAQDPYLRLARILRSDGIKIWFEADLVKAWLAGPSEFSRVITRLGTLAQDVEVVGFKVADELGYHDGLTSIQQARRFLVATRNALARVAPGRELLVDVVVPDLGCLPWRGAAGLACAEDARAAYPAAEMAAVASYLRAGLIDRLDLSTGLLDESTYAAWGLSTIQAQREAWARVRAAGWPRLTRLQGRKALAAPGGYQGSSVDAARDLATFVDVPRATGAAAIDVWTWRQPYDGQVVGLLGPDLAPNSLWTGLAERHRRGIRLFTHLTPSTMPGDRTAVNRECALVSQAFSAVFVAAGTG